MTKINWYNGKTANSASDMQKLCDAVNHSLTTPVSAPADTKIVAVDNTNSQKMLTIGNGLSIENDTLKANSENGALYRHSLTITNDSNYTIHCVLYSKSNATITNTTFHDFIQNNYIVANGKRIDNGVQYIIEGIKFSIGTSTTLELDNYYLSYENNNISIIYVSTNYDIRQATITDSISEI